MIVDGGLDDSTAAVLACGRPVRARGDCNGSFRYGRGMQKPSLVLSAATDSHQPAADINNAPNSTKRRPGTSMKISP